MENYYSIGQVSKKCKVSIKTLRYYDQIELIQPEIRDTSTNYRYYSKEQLTSLMVIRRLRALGFSIVDIKNIISTPSLSNFMKLIEKNNKDIDNQIQILNAKKAAGEVILSRILNGNNIIYKTRSEKRFSKTSPNNIKIEHIPSSSMIYSREIMAKYRNADVSLERWIDIYEKCTESGISMTSSIIVTYYSKPLDQFLMKDCDVEFGVLVTSDKNYLNTSNHLKKWGGFLACTAYHIGDYSEIINCHVALLQWINQKGYEVDGPISEEFIISPLDTKYKEKHITKVIIPIKQLDNIKKD